MTKCSKTQLWEEIQTRMLLLDGNVGLILDATLTFKEDLEGKINK